MCRKQRHGGYVMLRGVRHSGNSKVGKECRGQSGEGAMYIVWASISFLEHWKSGRV